MSKEQCEQDLLTKLSYKEKRVQNWYIAESQIGICSKIEVGKGGTRS